MRIIIPFVFVIIGCSDTTVGDDLTTPTGDSGATETKKPTDTDTNPGACGDVLFHTVEIIGAVENPDKTPAGNADVWLEERNYEPQVQIWGKGTRTDKNGVFTFIAKDVVEVEGCWGRIVDYALVARSGSLTAEDGNVNSTLRNAITYGTAADFSFFPLMLVEEEESR